MIRVKICGLTRREDAMLAADLGADALGFILEPTSPRYIGEVLPKWLSELPPMPVKVAVFGVVSRPVHRSIFDLVQGSEWEVLSEAHAKRIHTLRVRPGQRADDFMQQSVNAAALLLDSHKDGAYGGTGIKLDWDLAAEIVSRADRPVILAGGLTPDNVAEAIRRVRPFAVDVSSGVESSPGIKDPVRMRDFIQAARNA